VLIFKAILGVFRPKLSVFRIVLKWSASSTISIPFRIVSYTVPGFWEVDANKHLIVNSPPVAIINQESTIIFIWIKSLIFIWDTFNIFVNLFSKITHFTTICSPFAFPFCVSPRISNSQYSMSLPLIFHCWIRYFKSIH
jgi:hypothetical protein